MKTLLCSLLLATVSDAMAAILVTDSFAYSDGVLTNVSNGAWRHASGGVDQVDVEGGRVTLSRSETEDVEASLSTSYPASSGAVLYTRFSLFVLSPPAGANGNYFAHLDGGSARARVFVVTNGAATGRFRVGIAAGASTASAVWPVDLNTNEIYTILTRMVVSNAHSTLWVNPISNSDPFVSAVDSATGSSLNRFAWRQDSGMGTLLVDDLVVATSFEEALLGNEMPSISPIADQQLAIGGGTATFPFTVSDAETAPEALDTFARVVPSEALEVSFGGGASNRTLSVRALSDEPGQATVTVLVTDGVTTNSRSFGVTMVPALLLADDFAYFDGALVSNGMPPWLHHSGSVTGQLAVAGGKVILSGAQNEDVSVLLPGGPFSTNSGVMLYVSLLVNIEQLPGSSGDYFAHFNTTAGRCRLFANTANAAPGKFRLGVANGANTLSSQTDRDLSTNTDCRVVLGYDPATATSRLWVNPSSETDESVVATDAASPGSITVFALRQAAAIGVMKVDDLRIGLTFASVVTSPAARLRIERLPDSVRLSWPLNAAGLVLQFTDDLTSSNWQNMATAPFTVGNEYVITNSMTGRRFFRLENQAGTLAVEKGGSRFGRTERHPLRSP